MTTKHKHDSLKRNGLVGDIITSVGSTVTALISECTADVATEAFEKYKAREENRVGGGRKPKKSSK